MKNLFFEFLQTPDREKFLAVREAVASSETYCPYSNELTQADQCIDQGKFEEARLLVGDAMANLLLSPAAHLTLAIIAKKLGDAKGAEMEGFIAATCVQGILATGDGSRDSPYFVLRTSDEYDVIGYLGKKPKSQALTGDGDRHFDLIHCEDGSELWFDITVPFNKLNALMGD